MRTAGGIHECPPLSGGCRDGLRAGPSGPDCAIWEDDCMSRKVVCWIGALWFGIVAAQVSAQPLLKSAVQVNAGNTIPAGQTFGYRLTYNCSNTSGPCMNAEVDDLLHRRSSGSCRSLTVPACPTGDVAAINVTNNYMGSGTDAGAVRDEQPADRRQQRRPADQRALSPDGSTANGTTAVNTADAINLSATPAPSPRRRSASPPPRRWTRRSPRRCSPTRPTWTCRCPTG